METGDFASLNIAQFPEPRPASQNKQSYRLVAARTGTASGLVKVVWPASHVLTGSEGYVNIMMATVYILCRVAAHTCIWPNFLSSPA
eukprot:6200579-Pleurochrysis_carterae.AAC.4